jgi:hypothetical protein
MILEGNAPEAAFPVLACPSTIPEATVNVVLIKSLLSVIINTSFFL